MTIKRYSRKWGWKMDFYLYHPSIPSGNVITVWEIPENGRIRFINGIHLGIREPTRAKMAQAIEKCIQVMLDAIRGSDNID